MNIPGILEEYKRCQDLEYFLRERIALMGENNEPVRLTDAQVKEVMDFHKGVRPVEYRAASTDTTA